MKSFWDERYSIKDYIYGTQPNEFFKEQIDKLNTGKILMVGEGEGRNAVYAAKLGWQVDAIDSSSVAREKALSLAEQNKVSINYQIADIHSYEFQSNKYDALGIIFLHIDERITQNGILYKKLTGSLKKDGRIILELFSKNQIGKKTGGPQDLSLLYSVEQIRKNFPSLTSEVLNEENVLLSEGDLHNGEASVIRYVGVK